jgi:D-aminopeptidase
VLDAHVLGCLVVSNYGTRRDLHLLVGPEAAASVEAAPEPPDVGGSIMMLLGTDAPLSARQLRRLAQRATFGLGRAGSVASNASGEYALAFSTAHRVPHRSGADTESLSFLRDDSAAMRDLFEAAADVVYEAILGSLCSAEPMQGRDGNRAEVISYRLLDAVPLLRRG